MVSYSKLPNDAENNRKEVFKSIHLINLKPDASEQDLLNLLDELNKIISELRVAEVKYQLWKDRGDENKHRNYQYIMESTWPNQKVYDTVHNSEIYKTFVEKTGEKWEELIQDHVYTWYMALN